MFVIHIQNYSGYMYMSICQTPKGFFEFHVVHDGMNYKIFC